MPEQKLSQSFEKIAKVSWDEPKLLKAWLEGPGFLSPSLDFFPSLA